LVAQLGLISPYDGLVYVITGAMFWPGSAPYLLIIVSSIQDGRGFAVPSFYYAFIVISGIMISSFFLHFFRKNRNPGITSERMMTVLPAVALAAIAYSFFVSILGIYEQSYSRHYILVGILMAFMVISGTIAARRIAEDRDGHRKVWLVSAICLVHALLVGILQLAVGPDIFTSDPGMEAGIEQLVDTFALSEYIEPGYLRLGGPFLTPNAFALVNALLLMLLIRSYKSQKIGTLFISLYVCVGAFSMFLSLSKAMAAFFIATTLVLIWNYSRRAWVIFALPIVLISCVLIPGIDWSDWESAIAVFRWRGVSNLGARDILWNAVFDEFGWKQWLFGMGLTPWENFYSAYMQYPAADPHSYILSVPGRFGLPGAALYILTAYILFKRLRLQHPLKLLVAACLITLLFLKDLVSVPYLIHNNPVSFLIWLNICLLLVRLHGEQKQIRPGAMVMIPDEMVVVHESR
jgi:hypothetical protein